VFELISPQHVLLEVCIMTLFGWLREINGKQPRRSGQGSRNATAQRDATTQPRLEHLEDRLAPTFFSTTTNAAVGITPNFLTRTANETITATVTTGFTPVPDSPIAFYVNNQTSSAALNGNGQAAFSVTLPLFAVANNQTLQVTYFDFPVPPLNVVTLLVLRS
jgi:hypothetical protein